jgi:hypothetical protein
MSRLEDLQPNSSVRGILPDSLVTVVDVQWFGSEALELTYKSTDGKLANELLYRHDESRIEIFERAEQLKFQEQAGKTGARLNSSEARKRAGSVQARLEKRLEELKLEGQISPLPPVVIGGVLVVPDGLLSLMTNRPAVRARCRYAGRCHQGQGNRHG